MKEEIMNIKLKLLSIWTPKFLLKRELEKTSHLTNEYLDRLLKKNGIVLPPEKPFKGNIEQTRAHMALKHNMRVQCLIKELGNEKAVELGKEQMFKAGLELGTEARNQLKVETLEDTIAAAKILYKVLGIEFNIEHIQNTIILYVDTCALAEHYNPETCVIMSYADKGVLKGLNQDMDMEFVERITTGAQKCKACINYSGQKL
jgi:hypothetical protein